MSFAENLQKIRKIANLSQENLAEQLHITRQAISKWEAGQSTPDIETCLRLCNILDVSPNQLILGEESFVSQQSHSQQKQAKKAHFSITVAFLMLVLLCGTVILVCNLNSNAFEPYIHTLSIFMIFFSITVFGVTTAVRFWKKKHT